jgi:hypothetical protein
MNLTMLIIDSLLLLGIVCVSLYGASALPSGAKVPIHFGPASYNNWVPKNVGLIMWPAGAAVLYVVLVITARNEQATGGGGGAAIGLTVALVVVLITQAGALRVALIRGSGDT